MHLRSMADKTTDLSKLERFCKGDRQRMLRYIDLYMEMAPRLFADLKEHILSGDADGTARMAHGLRPQVDHMGATALFALLHTLESLARTQGASACKAHLPELTRLSERVMLELREARDQG